MCTGSVLFRRGRDQCVPTLVVGGDLLLFLVHQPGALLRAGDHAVDRLVEGVVVDQRLALAGGQQRCLVEHVREVGAGESRRAPRHRNEVDVLGQRLALARAPSRICSRPTRSGRSTAI